MMILRILTESGGSVAAVALLALLALPAVPGASPPEDVWDPSFGLPGTDTRQVHAFALHEGELYVGGRFRAVGRVESVSLARYDGVRFHAIEVPWHRAQVRALESWKGRLLVGGQFEMADGSFARQVWQWDGSDWSALAWKRSSAELFATDGEELIAVLTDSPHQVQRWSGAGWALLGDCATRVHALEYYQGNLYVGGTFVQMNGVASRGLVYREDGQWRPVAGMGAHAVHSLSEWQGQLAVGGRFGIDSGSIQNLALWDGSNWAGVHPFPPYTVTLTFGTADGLFAAGTFEHIGGMPVGGIARFDGQAWSSLDGGLSAPPNAALIFQGQLHVGGPLLTAGLDRYFPDRELPGVAVGGLARLDGERWEPFTAGRGIERGVWGVESIGRELYVFGNLHGAGTAPYLPSRLMRLGSTGWVELPGLERSVVSGVAAYDRGLVVWGSLDIAALPDEQSLARWDGQTWSRLGPGVDGGVGAVLVQGPDLLVAGAFSSTADRSTPLNRVARWDGERWHDLGQGLGPVASAYRLERWRGGLVAATSGGIRWYKGKRWLALDRPGLPLRPLDLEVHDGQLVAGGRPPNSVQVFDPELQRWNPLGTGLPVDARVEALLTTPAGLFAAGNLGQHAGRSFGALARWDGVGWSPVGGSQAGTAKDLAWHQNSLVVAGDVVAPDGTVSRGVARWYGALLEDGEAAGEPDRQLVSAPPTPTGPSRLLGVRSQGQGRRGVQIHYWREAPGPAALVFYDLKGRRVRALELPAGSPGEGSITWEGIDSSGRPVARGSYFVRLEAGERVDQRTVFLR